MTRFPSPLKQQRCRLDSAVVKVGCINHIISAFTFQWTQTRLPFRKTSNSLKSLLANQEVLKLGGKKWQTYEFLFVFLNHQRAQMFYPTVIKCFPVDRVYIQCNLACSVKKKLKQARRPVDPCWSSFLCVIGTVVAMAPTHWFSYNNNEKEKKVEKEGWFLWGKTKIPHWHKFKNLSRNNENGSFVATAAQWTTGNLI